ncbi:hypothetical protein C8R43DRAFT_946426 [Mycena crocata]|nr:hypothetical protein C8R43DRAFT_946426 [Mycena crocata]
MTGGIFPSGYPNPQGFQTQEELQTYEAMFGKNGEGFGKPVEGGFQPIPASSSKNLKPEGPSFAWTNPPEPPRYTTQQKAKHRMDIPRTAPVKEPDYNKNVKQKFGGTEEEIAGMIRKLSAMRLDDPEYAPVYYKVMVLDTTGTAARCVRAPNSESSGRMKPQEYVAVEPQHKNTSLGSSTVSAENNGAARTPSTYPNSIPLGGKPGGEPVGYWEQAGFKEQTGCFGCGAEGHRIFDCKTIDKLVKSKVLRFNPETRQLEMGNGAKIRKTYGETLAQAAERISGADAPRLPKARIEEEYTDSGPELPESATDESSEEGFFIEQMENTEHTGTTHRGFLMAPKESLPEDSQVNGVERTIPSTRTARKEIFDGVLLPGRERVKERVSKDDQDENTREAEPRNKGGVETRAAAASRVKALEAPTLPEPVPVQARKVRFDQQPVRDLDLKGHNQKDYSEKGNDTPSRVIGRQTRLTSSVDKENIVNRILDATVTITEGVLIKVEMETSGRPVVAIVDTGSQLDVVRADIAALVLGKPVDMSKITYMNDANGGKGQLQGWIDGVGFNCGGALTTAGLWVSQQAPFELLLGRPWQRGNLVSIDERDEGTYLVFKDRQTRRPRYELLVIPQDQAPVEIPVNHQYQSFIFVKNSSLYGSPANEILDASGAEKGNLEELVVERKPAVRRRLTIGGETKRVMIEWLRMVHVWINIWGLLGGVVLIHLDEYLRKRLVKSIFIRASRAQQETPNLFTVATGMPPTSPSTIPSIPPSERHEPISYLSRDHVSLPLPADLARPGQTPGDTLHAMVTGQWSRYIGDQELEVRPSFAASPQTFYFGEHTNENGDTVHEMANLNQSFVLTGPTGKPSLVMGHSITHLVQVPREATQTWSLEVPYPSDARIMQSMQHYTTSDEQACAYPAHSSSVPPPLKTEYMYHIPTAQPMTVIPENVQFNLGMQNSLVSNEAEGERTIRPRASTTHFVRIGGGESDMEFSDVPALLSASDSDEDNSPGDSQLHNAENRETKDASTQYVQFDSNLKHKLMSTLLTGRTAFSLDMGRTHQEQDSAEYESTTYSSSEESDGIVMVIRKKGKGLGISGRAASDRCTDISDAELSGDSLFVNHDTPPSSLSSTSSFGEPLIQHTIAPPNDSSPDGSLSQSRWGLRSEAQSPEPLPEYESPEISVTEDLQPFLAQVGESTGQAPLDYALDLSTFTAPGSLPWQLQDHLARQNLIKQWARDHVIDPLEDALRIANGPLSDQLDHDAMAQNAQDERKDRRSLEEISEGSFFLPIRYDPANDNRSMQEIQSFPTDAADAPAYDLQGLYGLHSVSTNLGSQDGDDIFAFNVPEPVQVSSEEHQAFPRSATPPPPSPRLKPCAIHGPIPDITLHEPPRPDQSATSLDFSLESPGDQVTYDCCSVTHSANNTTDDATNDCDDRPFLAKRARTDRGCQSPIRASAPKRFSARLTHANNIRVYAALRTALLEGLRRMEAYVGRFDLDWARVQWDYAHSQHYAYTRRHQQGYLRLTDAPWERRNHPVLFPAEYEKLHILQFALAACDPAPLVSLIHKVSELRFPDSFALRHLLHAGFLDPSPGIEEDFWDVFDDSLSDHEGSSRATGGPFREESRGIAVKDGWAPAARQHCYDHNTTTGSLQDAHDSYNCLMGYTTYALPAVEEPL